MLREIDNEGVCAIVEPNSASPRRLSVCHLASGDSWAGAEVQVASLMRALSLRPDVDLRLIVLNEGRLAQEARACGIEVAVIPQNSNSLPALVRKAGQFLSKRSVDVLHAHRDKEYLISLLIRRKLGSPFLVRTQHGRPEIYRGWIGVKSKVLHALDRRLASFSATRVVSVSAELTSYLGTYLSEDQIAVVRNGLDVSKVNSALPVSAAKERLGFRAETPVIGCVGRLVAVKRVDLFLQMASQILRQLPFARFVVVGDGRDRANLEQLARDLNLADRVSFLGHREDAHEVLRAMDVMVISSDREGLPISLLEAMHLGVPVVSRNVGGIPEVIQNRVSGMLVDSGHVDALSAACVDVLSDAVLREQITCAARRVVSEKYSSHANAEALVQLYRCFTDNRIAPGATA